MKKHLRTLFFVMMAGAVTGLTGCGSEKDEPDNPSGNAVELSGTSWLATVEDTYQSYPVELDWSLDFYDESTGELFMDLFIMEQSQGTGTIAFTYTFDGADGVFKTNQGVDIPFVYDSDAKTITANIPVQVDQAGTVLGGTTVFHQTV